MSGLELHRAARPIVMSAQIKWRRRRAHTCGDHTRLADRLRHRPAQLSIGQQQRVALARALANRPRLVLADEPTGNLDPRFALEALGLLRELCREQGAALICVSHDPRVLDDFGDALDFAVLNRAMAEEPQGS